MLRLFGHYLSGSAIRLFLVECAALLCILLEFGRSSYMASDDVTDLSLIGRMVGAMLFVTSLMYSVGLYDRMKLSDIKWALPRLLIVVLVYYCVVFIAISNGSVMGRGAKEITTAVVIVGSTLVAVIFLRALHTVLARYLVTERRTLVVGNGERAARIERLVASGLRSDVHVIGFVAQSGRGSTVLEQNVLPWDSADLKDIVARYRVREIVVALDDRRGVSLQPFLDARIDGIDIIDDNSFWEREARRINLEALEPSWLIYSDGFRITTVTNLALKRILDVSVSLFFTIFSLPTLILAMAAIKLEDGGPILYRQERVGRNGKTFKILKLRTMRIDAEKSGAPKWAAVGDPRVTRVGAFLRLTRIDEIPQIWNVLKGDMSFVGPRPERPFFVSHLESQIPYYSVRHRVRPGITGWAQINYPYGASIEDAREKLSYDLYYVKNFSILFDVLIIMSTLHAVIVNRGGR